jgi:hypothetical protein
MTLVARLFLLVLAAACAFALASAGWGFGCAVEADRCGLLTTAFWVVLGVAFASPFWLPAVVPARFPRTLRIVRWIGAVASAGPLLLFGSVVESQLHRAAESTTLWPAGMMAGMCAVAVVVLLRAELAAVRRRFT